MPAVLSWNTLEEAAKWLSKETKEEWTAKGVLDAANRHKIQLRAAPPKSTKFALYRWDTEKGAPSNPFVFQHAMPWQTLPLYPSQIQE